MIHDHDGQGGRYGGVPPQAVGLEWSTPGAALRRIAADLGPISRHTLQLAA